MAPFGVVLGFALVAAWMLSDEPVIMAAQRPPAPGLEEQFNQHVRPFLQQHCYECHGSGQAKGDIAFDKFAGLEAVRSETMTWKLAIEALEEGYMPPEPKARPNKEQTQRVVQWIKQAVEKEECKGVHDPGRMTIRRLNRTEYNNTIRDLLKIDFKPADNFPVDDTGYGFDNIADVLTMSPLLAEKYLAAAEQALDKALVPSTPRKPAAFRYNHGELHPSGNVNKAGDLMVNGDTGRTFEFPADGEYEIRIKAAQDAFGDEPARMSIRIGGRELRAVDVRAPRGKGEVITARTTLKAGRHRITVAFLNDRSEPGRGDRNLIVEYIEIFGPQRAGRGQTPSHQLVFFCQPGDGLSEEAAAGQIIERFASRAFRRPVQAAEVQRLTKLYGLGRQQGEDFEGGVKVVLTAVLVSPHFLFRIEQDPANPVNGAGLISDYELATRLSYFLWSSMPDEALFELAAKNELRKPGVIQKQIQRMLADPKSSAFVENFTGQWLELRNMELSRPDSRKYPMYSDRLGDAMRREVELFFESLIREDASVVKLLDADYTFVNEVLAKHYGIQGVSGDEYRRVKLDGTNRGGVLTMAGVLTVTSMPTRTSPVKRGKWVLEVILGTPPPPPPADVPALVEKMREDTAATLRQRLEQHRADPTCASCHVRMDGIGFALENFDGVGLWRDRDGRTPIDARGTLADGRELNGVADLRKMLLARKDDFVKSLVEKTMMYALGRGIVEHDDCTLRDITQVVRASEYRFSSLVTAIVQSDAFQKRRTR